jgi:hypothetical protein
VPLANLLKTKVKQQLAKEGKPGEVTQTLFGLVSFLRHLAIPRKLSFDYVSVCIAGFITLLYTEQNKETMAHQDLVQAVVPLLGSQLDIVRPLQNAVVGLLKHLTASNGASFYSISLNGQAPDS